MDELRRFILEVKENANLWLLEAKPGLFAMVEDSEENSYIPVWSSEQNALDNINEDWEGYNVTDMSVEEFLGWMNELHADNIGIAISAGEGRMLPVPAKTMKQLFAGAEFDAEDDKRLVGEEFYDEEWAEGIPDNWEEDFLDSLNDEEDDE